MAPSAAIDALTSILVARFLRSYDYAETLEAFIREAGLDADAGQSSGDDTDEWTIQSLLEEKKKYDQNVNFERYGEENQQSTLWSEPAPSKPVVVQAPTSANPLAVSVEQWQWQKPGDEDAAQSYIISTGSDKQVHLFNTKEGNAVVSSLSNISDSPVLSFVTILQGRYCLMTNMSGKLILQYQSQTLDSRKDHKKYAVKVVAHQDRTDQSKWWVATAGWDEMVILYCLNIPEGDASTLKIGEPFARIKIESNPQSLLFVPHVDTNELSLLVSREDSPQIYYYEVKATNEPDSEGDGDGEPVMSPRGAPLVGQQSLAPRSNSWGAFSPAHMVLSPHDPSLLAVATTSSLHLKVMIVRLLFPRDPPKIELDFSAQISQAADVMELLSITNREDAAILVQANTFAPQTAYSTPQLAWRPDGSGVWVNGDDGVVRGIETKTGKVVALLKGGHVEDCKVRTVWSGYVTVPQEGGDLVREEWVISGGFDKRLIIWKV